MSSKRYPEEFKIEAVRQVVERGHGVAEVASQLGSSQNAIGFDRCPNQRLSRIQYFPIENATNLQCIFFCIEFIEKRGKDNPLVFYILSFVPPCLNRECQKNTDDNCSPLRRYALPLDVVGVWRETDSTILNVPFGSILLKNSVLR